MLDSRYIIVGVLIALLVLALALFAVTPQLTVQKQKQQANFSLKTFGRVSDTGYAIYSAQGDGKIVLLSLKEKPTRKVYVLKDSGVEMKSFEDFVTRLHVLDKEGYEINIISPLSDVKDGVIIIPTGAMPRFFLEKIENSNSHIIYIGAKDLVISEGIKRQQWYETLPETTKAKIEIIEGTLDRFYENNKNVDKLITTLRENKWVVENKKEVKISGGAKNYTETIKMTNSSYIRLMWQTENTIEIYDSDVLRGHQISINATPNLFPWEKLEVMFEVEKSNGTVYVVIEKNGEEKKRDKWQRVSEGNVFIRSYSLEEPGTYIIKIVDNSGVIGGGATHVKDLQVEFIGSSGYEQQFSVKIDGAPVESGIARVSLNNSTKSYEFYIVDGMLSVPAKLNKGENVFHFELFGNKKDVVVENNQKELLDVYLEWGVPGLFLIIFVYGAARILKRPVYVVRVSDSSMKIRKELKISEERAKEVFLRTRKDLGISGPLTVNEYGFGLKRYVTEGAEITEGNVEQVLKHLCKRGLLECHEGFYQLKGEGDVKKNVLKRIIRDELIKKGICFDAVNDKFITKHYEIGFLGNHFEKKAFIVFDNEEEIKATLARLDERTKAIIALKQFNGMIEFVTKDRLEEVL